MQDKRDGKNEKSGIKILLFSVFYDIISTNGYIIRKGLIFLPEIIRKGEMGMLTFFTAFTAGSIAVMWLILLGVLLVVEIITLGLTTIWFAGGALAAFLAALAGGPLWLQIILFFAVSILLLIFTRPIAIKYMNKNVSKTNVSSLPGEKAVVIKTIDNLRGTGQAVVNGLEWSAKSKDETIIDEGKVVRIVAVEGVKLIVEEEK